MSDKKAVVTNSFLLGFVALLYGWWNPTFIPCAYGVFLFRTGRATGRRKDYRAWSVRFLVFLAVVLTAVELFNFTMDPLWCFSHVNRWNSEQIGFNERQQKTNMVTFRDFDYRTLLIGSSRLAFIDQNDFTGMKAFNYSVSSMIPADYQGYIRYARERNGRDFETIIVGLDFFGTNANLKGVYETPEHHIETANSLLYRYKMLLNYDVLRFSWQSLKENLADKKSTSNRTYNRFNVRTLVPMPPAERRSVEKFQLFWFMMEAFGKNYRYDEKLEDRLRAIRTDNPNSRVIVFTTPVSKPLFCLVMRQKLFPEYERWLREIVDVYGGFYNFMDINSVTADHLRTFSDTHHVVPEIGARLAHKVAGIRDDSVPKDFGTWVTRDNIDETISMLREQCAECR